MIHDVQVSEYVDRIDKEAVEWWGSLSHKEYSQLRNSIKTSMYVNTGHMGIVRMFLITHKRLTDLFFYNGIKRTINDPVTERYPWGNFFSKDALRSSNNNPVGIFTREPKGSSLLHYNSKGEKIDSPFLNNSEGLLQVTSTESVSTIENANEPEEKIIQNLLQAVKSLYYVRSEGQMDHGQIINSIKQAEAYLAQKNKNKK